jgi:hypothetical protein
VSLRIHHFYRPWSLTRIYTNLSCPLQRTCQSPLSRTPLDASREAPPHHGNELAVEAGSGLTGKYTLLPCPLSDHLGAISDQSIGRPTPHHHATIGASEPRHLCFCSRRRRPSSLLSALVQHLWSNNLFVRHMRCSDFDYKCPRSSSIYDTQMTSLASFMASVASSLKAQGDCRREAAVLFCLDDPIVAFYQHSFRFFTRAMAYDTRFNSSSPQKIVQQSSTFHMRRHKSYSM